MQVVSDNGTKMRILKACHDDAVGGCHFGRDKTAANLSVCTILLEDNQY